MVKKERARTILKRLRRAYTEPGEFVKWRTPLELVIGTVLSAQCTDKRVNQVTKILFKKYRSARAYARAALPVLEKQIYSTGFYRSKARYLKGIGTLLKKEFNGRVPRTKEDLMRLPGVSHKSANLIMGKLYGKHTGIAVDTHVMRLAPRLGLTMHNAQQKIAADLEKLFSSREYLDVNEYFIMHGRAICKPRPLCAECVLQDICPSATKFLKKK